MTDELDELEQMSDEAVAEYNERIRDLIGRGNDKLEMLRERVSELEDKLEQIHDQSDGGFFADHDFDVSAMLDELDGLRERVLNGRHWVEEQEARLI